MLNCTQCNAPISPEAKVCSRCGNVQVLRPGEGFDPEAETREMNARTAGAAAPIPATNMPIAATTRMQTSGSGKKAVIGVLVFVVASAIGVALGVGLRD